MINLLIEILVWMIYLPTLVLDLQRLIKPLDSNINRRFIQKIIDFV